MTSRTALVIQQNGIEVTRGRSARFSLAVLRERLSYALDAFTASLRRRLKIVGTRKMQLARSSCPQGETLGRIE
jgi:hypothetical protein